MKQRIYIDTSIVGGYFDEEFKEAQTDFSRGWRTMKYYLLFPIYST
ncbi:hypothetical protein [Pricia sp.]